MSAAGELLVVLTHDQSARSLGEECRVLGLRGDEVVYDVPCAGPWPQLTWHEGSDLLLETSWNGLGVLDPGRGDRLLQIHTRGGLRASWCCPPDLRDAHAYLLTDPGHVYALEHPVFGDTARPTRDSRHLVPIPQGDLTRPSPRGLRSPAAKAAAQVVSPSVEKLHAELGTNGQQILDTGMVGVFFH